MQNFDFGISKESFFENFYERNIYFKKATARQDVISWDEINQAVFCLDAGDNRIRLFKNGQIEDSEFIDGFTQVDRPRRVLEKNSFYRYMRSGATLVLNRFDSVSLTTKKLCDEVSMFTDSQAVANAYIAFSGDGTFGNHWDTHDVFAVQLRGRKRWKIYSPTFMQPLSNQTSKNHKHECPQEPVFDEILEAGDFLYIPRGWWHNVLPIGEETVHIAIGTHPPRALDFLFWICSTAATSKLTARESLSRLRDENLKLESLADDIKELLCDRELLRKFHEHRVSKQRYETGFDIQSNCLPVNEERRLMECVNTFSMSMAIEGVAQK
ncbi:cupin domain-containing protein [Denitratisoma sp. agr-D3]